jgi:hypothetical protein
MIGLASTFDAAAGSNDGEASGSPHWLGAGGRLFLCGLTTLYWELLLIRWMGSMVRVVSYYASFVLTAAFLGLGAGALLSARRGPKLWRLTPVALAVTVCAAALLGRVAHENLADASESLWLGSAPGIGLSGVALGYSLMLPVWLVLCFAYLAALLPFVCFGQWLGDLFRPLPSLRGYSTEILGSLAGVALFALLSAAATGPPVWVALGGLLLLLLAPLERRGLAVTGAATVLMLVVVIPAARPYLWSPYYKIHQAPITQITGADGRRVDFGRQVGVALTVNNDYHQMLLDLRVDPHEHPFLASWRALYEAPYAAAGTLPPGPILVVGAGTGNDVSAALRRTDRQIDAVEIDPAILGLGRALHPEHPYDGPRVHVVNDDARRFFGRTTRRYALVVFGFLDSHTVLSSFSSVRLDNFVYTRQSLERVKQLLVPGGRVALTFATNRSWIDARMIALLDQVFERKTETWTGHGVAYHNGILYQNVKSVVPEAAGRGTTGVGAPPDGAGVAVPTDDWPFLYLRAPGLPAHYRWFMAVIVLLGGASLLLLPRSARRPRLPYFLLGMAFLLLETSNVVSLSVLYGSTWIVNLVVFSGMLSLILLGNLAAVRLRALRLPAVVALLLGNLGAAYLVPVSALLSVGNAPLRAVGAILLFLGPVLFSAILFARLIERERDLAAAYGSNVLGAMVGGAVEYLSLVFGFKALLIPTALCYLGAYLLVRRSAEGV